MSFLTPSQINKINKAALADKYDCSAQYVGQVLSGKKAAGSIKAQSILDDALSLIEILEAKPEIKTEDYV